MQTSGIFCGSRLGQDRQVFEKSSHPKSLKIAQKLPERSPKHEWTNCVWFFFHYDQKINTVKVGHLPKFHHFLII